MPQLPPPPPGMEYETDAQGNVVQDERGGPVLRPTAQTQLAALEQRRDAGQYVGPQSWARHTAFAPLNATSLVSTNPNAYQNQHNAAGQFAALNEAEKDMPANRRTTTINVQGINGENSYTQRPDGQVVPTAGSLDYISYINAGGK